MTEAERKQLLAAVSGDWPILLRAIDENGDDDGGKPFYLQSYQDERMFVDFGNSRRNWYIAQAGGGGARNREQLLAAPDPGAGGEVKGEGRKEMAKGD